MNSNVLDLANLARSGIPKKVKNPSKQEMIKCLDGKRSTSGKIGIKMNLSHSTVINYARRSGFSCLKLVEIPKLNKNN